MNGGYLVVAASSHEWEWTDKGEPACGMAGMEIPVVIDCQPDFVVRYSPEQWRYSSCLELRSDAPVSAFSGQGAMDRSHLASVIKKGDLKFPSSRRPQLDSVPLLVAICHDTPER